MKQIALQYFELFSNKEIAQLEKLFNLDVTLRDWEIEAKGIDQVLAANKKIFDGVDTIKVLPINMVEDGLLIFAELEILINELEIIKVVDVIEFSENKKISAIRAFKG